MAAKIVRVPPMTKSEFLEKAKPITVSIGGVPVLAAPRKFGDPEKVQESERSVGWYANTKTIVEVDGKSVEVTVGFPITAIGSREWAA